ncbi:MAG: hypothetical protein JWM07_219 [Candidatus Saccharibacteria bacterium]|jgi:hypothetical protein|nr:hypothetical protein [Candidatus Saccharibacteria bacterium]
MSKPVGELAPEPEPSPLKRVVHDGNIVTDTISAEPDMTFAMQKQPSLEVVIAEEIANNYRKLCPFRRNDLEFAIKEAMADRTYAHERQEGSELAEYNEQYEAAVYEQHFDAAHVMMNNQPLFFDTRGAMVKGVWDGEQLVLVSYDELSEKQKDVLLGGIAVFKTFHDKKNETLGDDQNG